jgi:hypothetical protein
MRAAVQGRRADAQPPPVHDHEQTESSAAALIHFAVIRLMLQRLA